MPAGPAIAVLTLPASGHVNPALPLLAALAGRGARVVAWSAPEFLGALEAAGCEARDYGDLGADYANPPRRIAGVALMLAEITERLMPRIAAEVGSIKPAVVAHDSMAPWGRVAARALGRPSVCLTATFAVHRRVRLPPRVAAGLAADEIGGLPAAIRLAAASRRLAAAYGTPLGGPLATVSNRRGGRTIVFTSREFQPNAAAIRDEVHYVGPLAAVQAPGGEPALGHVRPEETLVYVSLGTLFEAAPAFYRAAAAGLAAPGRRVLMSIGRTDPGAIGPLPIGVEVRPQVDQRAVLRRARLFVTHGGLNSVHESLVAGVPMLLRPQSADQPVVAARAAGAGAGRVLRRADAATIRAAADAALRDPRVREAAERVGAGLRAAVDLDRAADLVVA